MIEFFRDEAGEFRFRVKARNGEILVTSEGYTRRHDTQRGLDTLLAVLNGWDPIDTVEERNFPARGWSDWKDWKGGDCPVPAEATVEAMLRNGEKENAGRADRLRWTHDGSSVDIILYRVRISDLPK